MNLIRSALCCAVLAAVLAGAPPARTQGHAESYNQQGIAFYRQQRFREAVDAFTNAITLDPDSSITTPTVVERAVSWQPLTIPMLLHRHIATLVER